MLLIARKRSIFRGVRDVVIAPFVLCLGSVYAFRHLLLAIAILAPIILWLAGEPPASLIPSAETGIMILLTFGGIAIAAVPLAVRDYFSVTHFEWKPSAEAISAGNVIAGLIADNNLESCYRQFSTDLKSKHSFEEFRSLAESLNQQKGPILSVVGVEETEIDCDEYLRGGIDREIDTVLEIAFTHHTNLQSRLLLFLNSRKEFQVENFIYLDLRQCH